MENYVHDYELIIVMYKINDDNVKFRASAII